MPDNRRVRQYLQWLKSAGVTHLPSVVLPEPTTRGPRKPARRSDARPDRSAATSGRPAVSSGRLQSGPASATASPAHRTVASTNTREAPPPLAKPEPLAETRAILESPLETPTQQTAALQQLAEVVSGCQRCVPLAESRRQTVFGVGDPNASIMFIGEAPGADEDRQGEPFVGAAGQLLDKIIAACHWQREDIYICNVLRCRPPGNRNPLPQEALNCREFLDGQIRIVNPDYIVCWGAVAAQNLLNETRSVGRLRGQFLSYGSARVLCTYHPSYLLRNASAKKQVWEDMQLLMAEIEKDGSSPSAESGATDIS